MLIEPYIYTKNVNESGEGVNRSDSQKITKMNKFCSRAREVVNHIDSKLKRNLTSVN